jgi:hypothetical protein
MGGVELKAGWPSKRGLSFRSVGECKIGGRGVEVSAQKDSQSSSGKDEGVLQMLESESGGTGGFVSREERTELIEAWIETG